MNMRVNTIEDPSTSAKNLVNLDPVNPGFSGRVCAGQATVRWALSQISINI